MAGISHGALAQAWRELEESTPTAGHRLRTLKLEKAPPPRLTIALDSTGARHLLIPVSASTRVRKGLDGPGLFLRRQALEDAETYQVYADLHCPVPELAGVFSDLVADIALAVDGDPKQPLKVAYVVIDRWKALFASPHAKLSTEAAIGLFGELSILRRLLDLDASAHATWVGPDGAPHDFDCGQGAIEVKASTRSEGRRFRVHGLDQLDAPSGGVLHLAWLRLRARTDGGSGLNELVDGALATCDDESALRRKLAAASYDLAKRDQYEGIRFEIAEERWYRVDAEFPRLSQEDLSAAGVAIQVTEVEYTVDVSAETPPALEQGAIAAHLEAMARSGR